MKLSIILLRTIHGIFAIYFTFCLFYIYYSAVTIRFNTISGIALVSLASEGFLVFILNQGECPLIHLQKRIDDPVPFFNLFLPEKMAVRAIPFFTLLTIIGLVFFALRLMQI
jgi:hypothetical protein